jgi:hypothetical protein
MKLAELLKKDKPEDTFPGAPLIWVMVRKLLDDGKTVLVRVDDGAAKIRSVAITSAERQQQAFIFRYKKPSFWFEAMPEDDEKMTLTRQTDDTYLLHYIDDYARAVEV